MAIGATAMQAAQEEQVEINLRLEIPAEFLPDVPTCFKDASFFIGDYFES
jgi:hypothetical protein